MISLRSHPFVDHHVVFRSALTLTDDDDGIMEKEQWLNESRVSGICESDGIWESTELVLSYKVRDNIGFGLVEMAFTTNRKPTIFRSLYENAGTEHKLDSNKPLIGPRYNIILLHFRSEEQWQHSNNIGSMYPHFHPANTRYWTNVGLMLAHRLRRWPNSKPTLAG